MDPSALLFYVLATIALISSLLVVLRPNPVASAFSLVVAFFCFAGIFALLQAHFLAAIQVLVYAGAIMVLFVFVIMLLNADVHSTDLGRSSTFARIAAGIAAIGFVALFVKVFRETSFPVPTGAFSPEAISKAGGNTKVVSELLFSEWILPFELTSVLLLAAIVGTVAIAKRGKKGAAK